MAQNIGKQFETDFKKSCDVCGICNLRLSDSNKYGFGSKTRFTPKNPCDFILYVNPNIYFLELKSTITGSISFNQPITIQEKDKPKPDIKSEQINSLIKYNMYTGTICGLVLRFEDKDTHIGNTYFIDVDDFVKWTTNVKKKSINEKDAKQIGIEISSTLLKVNKTYNIYRFIEDIQNKYNRGSDENGTAN